MRNVAVLLTATMVMCLGAARAAGVPDTGQDQCYDGTTMVACTAANTGNAAAYPRQDARFGRDAKATTGTLTRIGGGMAGFDYTKICNSGDAQNTGSCPANPALGIGATDWACTRDNITGLIWEVKTATATGLRHAGHTYTWYSTDGTINGGNAGATGTTTSCNATLGTNTCNTQNYIAAVNGAAGLCGASDWRLPTIRELLTLVHAGATTDPRIDTTYFPNTPTASSFWSGSSSVPTPLNSWGVNFGSGNSSASAKAGESRVRLVRGGQF